MKGCVSLIGLIVLAAFFAVVAVLAFVGLVEVGGWIFG